MLRLMSFVGLAVMLGLAWLLSENRWKVDWRLVLWGVGLQFGLGVLLLLTPVGDAVFAGMNKAVGVLNQVIAEGASVVFDNLTKSLLVKDYTTGEELTLNAAFAFRVLPVIIFVSALSAILYHLRVTQTLVRGIAWIMRRTLKTSGAETFAAALLIFLGMEAVTGVRAYLKNMTRSELCTIMTTFMATIAGSVMVAYTLFGADPGHLLAASLMSAPAAILISKLLVPETGEPETRGAVRIRTPVDTYNVVDAASRGTTEGLHIALNVGATVLVFVALVSLLNLLLDATVGRLFEDGFTFIDLMGLVFRPFAYLMGVAPKDAAAVSELLGTKTVLNEFLAYMNLQAYVSAGELSPRSVIIATYALCGFANPGSLGIAIAVITSLAPERREDIVKLGLKSLIGGTLACFSTACVAGMLIDA